MSTDFRQVLRDMEKREAHLLAELKDIQAAKPALQRMANAMSVLTPAQSPSSLNYAGLGTRDAITSLLARQSRPMTVAKIAEALIQGGIKTKSADFSAVVKSTLAVLKIEGKVERKEDGWVASSMTLTENDPSEPLLPSLQ